LEKQPNFIFGLVRACADKIQLRFQKRSLAAAERKKALVLHPPCATSKLEAASPVQKEPKKLRVKPQACANEVH